MPAGRHNFVVEQGTTHRLQIVAQDAAGDGIDLTGYTAAMQLRAAITDEAPALTLTSGAGLTLGGIMSTIDVLLTAAQTAGLAAVATSGAYGDLSGRPTLGTAAPLNVAAAGNAAAGEVVSFETLPGLGADHLTIPADGVTPATLHFASATDAGPHAWSVNNAAHAEPAEQDVVTGLYWSAIEVTRSAPDLVEVTVGGESLTIEAV